MHASPQSLDRFVHLIAVACSSSARVHVCAAGSPSHRPQESETLCVCVCVCVFFNEAAPAAATCSSPTSLSIHSARSETLDQSGSENMAESICVDVITDSDVMMSWQP